MSCRFWIALLVVLGFLWSAGLGPAKAEGLPAEESAAVVKSGMTLSEALILGVVEGLTEYLPVSSTGHLLVAGRLLGLGEADDGSGVEARVKEANDAYTICIQAGAIVAVAGLYFRRLRQMGRGLAGKDATGRNLLINVASGFLPAALIGFLFSGMIKIFLFDIWPVVVAWFVGGVAILGVAALKPKRDRIRNPGLSLEEMSWKMALVIGLAQCIAMWPGVSRSLVTIVGGVLAGLSLPAAVEFSFLLGLITLGAATAYDALLHGRLMVETFDALPLIVGLAAAFGSAVLSVKWMVGYLKRHGLALFGFYRIAAALVTGALLLSGRL
ncbi:MAG: undecaprenyl-diphosphate phosphatase [Syntrophotaleaceae bacterium]